MKVNGVTCVVLGSILVIFCRPTLLKSDSSLSLSDERFELPRTAREKQPGKHKVRDQSANSTLQRSVPVLRIRGRAHAATPPDVSVTCTSTGFVLRVKKRFYGFSAVAEELRLGDTCESNGIVPPRGDLLFTYALTDCQTERQVLPEYVVYKNILRYVPLSDRLPVRDEPMNVAVECRYPRHMQSLVATPTWQTPLRKIIRSRSGDFRIQLMDDSWSSPVRSTVFLLGQNVHVQVSTRHHYSGVKLFINSCHVTTVNPLGQAKKYILIDNYGCLQESRINPDASRFRFSQADNVVQFTFGAFQFTEAPDAQLSLHCDISISGGDPSPTQKACFYRNLDKRWISMFGEDSVCDCCDSVCNQTKSKQVLYEGIVSSDQVTFSDPVTSLSTLPSSTFNTTLMAHSNYDVIWFEVKEPQRSYTHEELAAPNTLKGSSEEDHDKRQKSHISAEKLMEEEWKETEEHGDVEILMAISKSFEEAEGSYLNLTEQLEVAPLNWSGQRNMQDMSRSQRNRTTKAQRVEEDFQMNKVSMKASVTVSKTMNELLNMSDKKPDELFLPSFISEETEEGDHDSEAKKEGLDLFPQYEEKVVSDELVEQEVVVSDELVEQGLVAKLELAQDLDDYFSDGA